jgi:predicted nuclease with TOPRIM domain
VRRFIVPKKLFRRIIIMLLVVLTVAGLFLIDSNAQRRRRRTRRRPTAPRITNPQIYQPPANDNSSTSTETGQTENSNSNQNMEPSASENPEEMRKTIRSLSAQVDKLNDKLGQMEQSQRSLLDLERLSRAEQRATSLRAELRDIQQKEADLQARLEDLDYALKPENIERAVAGFGSTRPEEVRAQRKRQLETERERVAKQLDQLATSHARIDEAIAASDVEIERLRKRLDEVDKTEIQNQKGKSQANEENPSPTPKPSPTPY